MARDLVPVFSFLWTRGRCRFCAAPISRHHLVIEALAALIGAVALLVAPSWQGLAGALFGWALLLLAALDFRHYWLPDRVTGAMAVLGLIVGAIGTFSAPVNYEIDPDFWTRIFGMVFGFIGLALVALAYRAVRKREGLGGGDPKLLGAIGAWLGWYPLPLLLLGATMIGLTYILAKALRREKVELTDKLPLGALMAVVAFPIWVVMQP